MSRRRTVAESRRAMSKPLGQGVGNGVSALARVIVGSGRGFDRPRTRKEVNDAEANRLSHGHDG